MSGDFLPFFPSEKKLSRSNLYIVLSVRLTNI